MSTPLPTWTLDPVDPAAMRALAPILDDPNPIHLDGAAAARVGLGDRPINQGPANIGYVTTMLRRAFPDAQLRRLQCRLTGLVRAGDAVTAGGELLETLDGVAHCAVWLQLADGTRVVEGAAELVLAPSV
jgi:3-hydroxybutyryl-CoA dehydratase